MSKEELNELLELYNGPSEGEKVEVIMEIYDLNMDIDKQLYSKERVFNC